MPITRLFICEKPAQARDIARLLSCQQQHDGFLSHQETAVSWCYGHLLELAEPERYCPDLKPWRLAVLPIIPPVWQLQVKANCQKQFAVLKKLLQHAQTVVIATDADREGELIAREILVFCQYRGNVQRLWLSALDDASIQKALLDIREGKTTEHLYQAGLSRQRADWLIGMNMTMAASVLFAPPGEGVLSVGRVQTPTLKLVVARDQQIENFQPRAYYELTAQLTTDQGETFTAYWQPQPALCDDQGRCLDQQAMEKVAAQLQHQQAVVETFQEQVKQQPPPLCLSLSALQTLASIQFGFSAQQTLDIAQSLYETHKAITYPRTDCGYLPESQRHDVPLILAHLAQVDEGFSALINLCDPEYPAPVWNDQRITAHHAIIPTLNKQVSKARFATEELKLYDLIVCYFIAQFLGPYYSMFRSTTLRCAGELLSANAHTPLVQGWKKAFRQAQERHATLTAAKAPRHSIPLLAPQQTVALSSTEIRSKTTQPPAHFTEGTLIEAMKTVGKHVQDPAFRKVLKETAGIGTEATRAAMLETLFKRGLLVKKGKHVLATAKGRNLIALLPPVVCDPLLTAQWEQALDSIAHGELTADTFLQQQQMLLHQLLAVLKNQAPAAAPVVKGTSSPYSCPHCQKPLVRRLSKRGLKPFWGCSQFPACHYLAPDAQEERAPNRQPPATPVTL